MFLNVARIRMPNGFVRQKDVFDSLQYSGSEFNVHITLFIKIQKPMGDENQNAQLTRAYVSPAK